MILPDVRALSSWDVCVDVLMSFIVYLQVKILCADADNAFKCGVCHLYHPEESCAAASHLSSRDLRRVHFFLC